jgi:subtilisin family serine protease
MSAPHVTGALALLLAKKPTLTARDAVALLRANVDPTPVDKDELGAGRIDVKRAYDAV